MSIKVKIIKKAGGGGGGGLPDKYTLKLKSNASTADWEEFLAESIEIDDSSDAAGAKFDMFYIGKGGGFTEEFGIEAGIVYVLYTDPDTHEELDEPIVTIALTPEGWTDPGHATIYIPEESYNGYTAMFIDEFLDDVLGIVDSVIPPTGPGIASLVFSISPAYAESNTFAAYRSGDTFIVELATIGSPQTFTLSAPIATSRSGSTVTDIWFVSEGERTKMDSTWSLQIPNDTEGSALIEATIDDTAVTMSFTWSNYGSM